MDLFKRLVVPYQKGLDGFFSGLLNVKEGEIPIASSPFPKDFAYLEIFRCELQPFSCVLESDGVTRICGLPNRFVHKSGMKYFSPVG